MTTISSYGTRNTTTGEHLASIIRSLDVVTALEPMPGGSLRARTETWISHWQAAHWLGDEPIVSAVEQLNEARTRYIESGFDLTEARGYCFRYFSLLELVLASTARIDRPTQWERVLRMVLAFECFPIRDVSPARGGESAATTTLRNPAYLLGRLKAPQAGDDTKFLPLATLNDGRAARLFFHYRQFRVAQDPPFAMLALLPNDGASRLAGLRLAGNVGRALHSNPDPYAHQRGNRLWRGILHPLIDEAVAKSQGGPSLEIVDVGSGSGRLTSDLCHRYVEWYLREGLEPLLRLWFVERSGHDKSALFRDRAIGRCVRGLTVLPSDYQVWLGKSPPLPASSGLRVGIISKVFDLASTFTIEQTSVHELDLDPVERANSANGGYLPTRCLAPSGAGPETLIGSDSRLAVERGHLFPQLSLSSYYRALSMLAGSAAGTAQSSQVALPVRVFDPDSLIAIDGSSVLERICSQCAYVVVEDQDLRPVDMLGHLKALSLRGLAVLDLTRAMGLKENYCYLLWCATGRAPPVEGTRLW
jgi:hypothetical protein